MGFTPLAGTRAPVRVWTDPYGIEPQALQQLRNIARAAVGARRPVMPDVHFGKGATVGSVIAMRQAVSPAAVGVDIGCGMDGVLTSLTAADLPDDLSALRSRDRGRRTGRVRQAHEDPVDPRRMLGLDRRLGPASGARSRACTTGCRTGRSRPSSRWDARRRQPLHRGLPRRTRTGGLADAALRVAATSARNWPSGTSRIARTLPHNADLPDRDLAVFLAGTPEMDAYRRDLTWAQEYASRNRAVMLALVLRGGAGGVRAGGRVRAADLAATTTTWRRRRYDGVDLLVTRKGAIRAGRGRPRASSRGRWAPGRTSSAGSGNRSVVLLGLARGGPADEPQRGEAPVHASTTWSPRPPGSSAARTPVWSTRSPARTRTSSRSSPRSPTWSRSSPTSSRSSA